VIQLKEIQMRTRSLIIVTTLALLLAMPAFAAGPDGAALFKGKCVSCHGADGSGQTPVGKSMKMRDLRSDEVQKQTDIELTKVISGGKGKMPAYGKQFSTPDISALIVHIRTLKAK
jgi:cytochrome c6